MEKHYCDKCQKFVKVKIGPETVEANIEGKKFTYTADVCRCIECGNEVYDDVVSDTDVTLANNIYRGKIGMVTVEEIEKILSMYNIGKKPLSSLLGWGEVTISRYCEGAMPKKEYSNKLKTLADPYNMLFFLLHSDKDKLTNIARKKVVSAVVEVIKQRYRRKIDGVIHYFLKSIVVDTGETITPLKLQKLLYVVQGWNLAFNKQEMYSEKIEAWAHGPVVSKIYSEFKEYGYNPLPHIDAFDETLFSKKEIKILELVRQVYSPYEAKTLERLTHAETPWQLARKGCKEEESSQNLITISSIKEYYEKVAKENQIDSANDVAKIREYVFEKLLESEKSNYGA